MNLDKALREKPRSVNAGSKGVRRIENMVPSVTKAEAPSGLLAVSVSWPKKRQVWVNFFLLEGLKLLLHYKTGEW